jgi:hypothetical protein
MSQSHGEKNATKQKQKPKELTSKSESKVSSLLIRQGTLVCEGLGTVIEGVRKHV